MAKRRLTRKEFPWSSPIEAPDASDLFSDMSARRRFSFKNGPEGAAFFDASGELSAIQATHGELMMVVGRHNVPKSHFDNNPSTPPFIPHYDLTMVSGEEGQPIMTAKGFGEDFLSAHIVGMHPKRRLLRMKRLFDSVAMPGLKLLGAKGIEARTPNESIVNHLKKHYGATVKRVVPEITETAQYDRLSKDDIVDPKYRGSKKWYEMRIPL